MLAIIAQTVVTATFFRIGLLLLVVVLFVCLLLSFLLLIRGESSTRRVNFISDDDRVFAYLEN